MSKPATTSTALTPAESVTLATLHEKGLSYAQIAQVLGRGVSPAQVKQSTDDALDLLKVFSPQFAQHWLDASAVAASKGDHKPAKEALEAAKVVAPPKQPSAPVSAPAQFYFGFAFGGVPEPPRAVIDANVIEVESGDR
jgi:hypothetical protein